MSQNQRKIQDFFRTASTVNVGDSSLSSTNPLKDLPRDSHLDDDALQELDEADSEPEGKLKLRLMNLQFFVTPPHQPPLPAVVCARRLASASAVLMLALPTILSLVPQTLWSQGAYRLEIISAHSDKRPATKGSGGRDYTIL